MNSLKKHFNRGEILFLSVICAINFFLLLIGLNGDSPYAFEADEWDYGPHTIFMLQYNNLNPQWFANPASTVYYALYAYYSILRVFYSPSMFPEGVDDARIAFEHMPLLILVPRFVNALLTVATLFLTYLVGRKWLGRGPASIATIMFAFCSEAVRLGQVLRTDALTDFFLLLGLWIVQKADSEPQKIKHALTGAIVTALAVSTRYFGLALAVPFGVTYLIDFWQTKNRKILMNLALYLVLLPVLFFCFSPYVLLDYKTALDDLRFEATSDLPGVSGASFAQNVAFYTTDCLPLLFGWALTFMMGLGFFLVAIMRRTKMTASLMLFLTAFAVGTCLNTRSWYRWMVPMVPGFSMLAGFAVSFTYDVLARVLTRFLNSFSAKAISFLIVWFVFCASLAVPMASVYLMELDKSRYSGNAQIYRYVRDHIPAGAKIAVDFDWSWAGIWLYDVKINTVKYETNQPRDYVSPRDLARQGYQYLIVGEWSRAYFTDESQKYPKQGRFYQELEKLRPLYTTTENTETACGLSSYNRYTRYSIYDLRLLQK